MNFTKRQKHKVDISIHRETIYQNVFYGNDFTTKTRKHSALHLVKSGIKGIGKIVAAPFVFLAVAAFSFVRPKGKNVPFTEEDAVPFVSTHSLRKEKKHRTTSAKMSFLDPQQKQQKTIATKAAKPRAKAQAVVPLQPKMLLAADALVELSEEKTQKAFKATAKGAPSIKANGNVSPQDAKTDQSAKAKEDVFCKDHPALASLEEDSLVLNSTPAATTDEPALSQMAAASKGDENRKTEKRQKKTAAGGNGSPSQRRRWRKAAIALCACALLFCLGVSQWYLFDGRYNEIIIVDDGKEMDFRTDADTVGEVLEREEIVLSESDIISCSLATMIVDGMTVTIDRADEIKVTANGQTTTVYLTSPTVAQVLEAAGVAVDEDDEINYDLDTVLTDPTEIVVVKVEVKTETTTETIAYETETRNSSSMLKGTSKVTREGKDGLRTITTEVVYKDGVEVSRSVVSSEVTVNPVNKIVTYGTRPTTSGSTNQGDAPTAEMIEKTIVVPDVTAYTWTGNKTATGKWPTVGMCGSNPKYLPYGTKLYVPGYGYCTVEDTGHASDDLYIDLYMDTVADCYAWGRKYNMTVYIIKDGY